MNDFEIVQLLSEANNAVNANFEFWLSGSFAVLLAFFFTGNKIVGFVKWTLLALYVSASMLFSLRLFLAGAQIQRSLLYLDETDSEILILNPGINTLAGVMYASILLFGTIATVYFGLNSKELLSKKSKSDKL